MTPLHIASLALIASLVSLWLSIRTARFNAAVKSNELATALETRMLSAQERVRRIKRDIEDCRVIAEQLGSQELLQALTSPAEIESLGHTIDEFRSAVASAKQTKIVPLHRLMMAKMAHVDTWLEVIAADFIKLKSDFRTAAETKKK